jgi:ADP-ribosylglycohydrolase
MTNDATREDAALGAVLGALVGDAAGAVLEFFGHTITAADVEHALTMPGGGTWGVAPGQITDDGELTMSLLNALCDVRGALPLELPAIVSREERTHPLGAASHYERWVASAPFDMGATTAASLGCTRREPWKARAREAGTHVAMSEAARERCMGSKANGSLMRATPLGVWGATRGDAALVSAAMADAQLSHPNAACVDACVAYTLAIASLVRAPGDAASARSAARAWVQASACDEVRTWFEEAEADVRVPYTPQDGFVRIAFTHAFRHLARGTSYVDALRETLLGGGDTDTNACIVGGLLGARWGASAVPGPMRAAVLGCDTARGKNPRPAFLHPRKVEDLVRVLLEA